MATFERIIVEKADGICTITFNFPERLNPWGTRPLGDFEVLFDDLAQDDAIRAVIITGKGRGFCSGADLSDIPDQIGWGVAKSKETIRRHDRMVWRLVEFEKPLIAALNGVAVGAGLNMALACDFIIASEQARVSSIFVRRGLLPDFGGMWLLQRAVGLARAKELVYTGDIIDAR
ncbi:MAG: enoyl-CoA hydratase/isomerase family protein, partial [Chloroflexota bacterium]